MKHKLAQKVYKVNKKDNKVNMVVFQSYYNALTDREKRALQTEMKDKFKVPYATFYKWISGARIPKATTCFAIAYVVGMDMEKLFPGI